jgi:hypothetical protein
MPLPQRHAGGRYCVLFGILLVQTCGVVEQNMFGYGGEPQEGCWHLPVVSRQVPLHLSDVFRDFGCSDVAEPLGEAMNLLAF